MNESCYAGSEGLLQYACEQCHCGNRRSLMVKLVLLPYLREMLMLQLFLI